MEFAFFHTVLSCLVQSKPSLKTSQAILSPVKTTPAASISSKAAPAKTLPLSQGKPTPKPAVLKQAKATPGRTAAPAKPAESANPAESTDSSGSEEDLPVPVSQKVGDSAFSSLTGNGLHKAIVQPLNAITDQFRLMIRLDNLEGLFQPK